MSMSFFAASVYSRRRRRRRRRSSPGRGVPAGVDLDASSGPFFRFVPVPRGKRTGAIFFDVRGAKTGDV